MSFEAIPESRVIPDRHLVEEFRRSGRKARLEAGAFLWHEGDPPGVVVLVEDGALDVLLEAEDGHAVVLRTLGPGSLLGEMSCFDHEPHSATVRAASACCVHRMTASQFREMARRHPDFLEALLSRQSERVRTLGVQVTRLAFESVMRRLARFLLEATAASGSAVIRLTHQDIATRVAATRESVSKALGALAREGRVRLSRATVEVLDRPGLEEEARDSE